jgi:steroid 5-alpha reductase family enzyme
MTLLLTLAIYAISVLILVTTVFLVAQVLQDNSIMDIAYGPIYALATWSTIFFTSRFDLLSVTVAIAVTIWALRLGIRIGRKNIGAPEDARYAAWREEWTKKGTLYFVVRSYLQINLLQGIVIGLVSLPIILAIVNTAFIPLWYYLGLALFAFGLAYESVADWQLDAFIAKKKAGATEATLMKQGLFRYSRRPNYFGEATLWWGLALTTLFLPFGFIGLIGPLVITYTVYAITGPMLEKNFLQRYPDEYAQYQAETNYFVPGPKKG